MDAPRHDTVSISRRAWAWLGPRGLTQLGVGAILAGSAAALFGGANLIRGSCDETCIAIAGVPAGILETLGFVAILAGIAAVGHWIGQSSHDTWLDRMRLELEAGAVDPARQDRLQRLTERPEASAIQRRARLNVWTAAPITALSALMIPAAMGNFADPDGFAPYLLPIVLLAAIAGAAATTRGAMLLGTARRLSRPAQG